jgi:hypothetical protein
LDDDAWKARLVRLAGAVSVRIEESRSANRPAGGLDLIAEEGALEVFARGQDHADVTTAARGSLHRVRRENFREGVAARGEIAEREMARGVGCRAGDIAGAVGQHDRHPRHARLAGVLDSVSVDVVEFDAGDRSGQRLVAEVEALDVVGADVDRVGEIREGNIARGPARASGTGLLVSGRHRLFDRVVLRRQTANHPRAVGSRDGRHRDAGVVRNFDCHAADTGFTGITCAIPVDVVVNDSGNAMSRARAARLQAKVRRQRARRIESVKAAGTADIVGNGGIAFEVLGRRDPHLVDSAEFRGLANGRQRQQGAAALVAGRGNRVNRQAGLHEGSAANRDEPRLRRVGREQVFSRRVGHLEVVASVGQPRCGACRALAREENVGPVGEEISGHGPSRGVRQRDIFRPRRLAGRGRADAE